MNLLLTSFTNVCREKVGKKLQRDTTSFFRLKGKCLAGKNWKAQIVCRAGHTIISKWMHVCFCFVRCCPPCIPRRCAGDIKKYVRFDFDIGGAGSKIWGGRICKGYGTWVAMPKAVHFNHLSKTNNFEITLRATLPGPQRRIKMLCKRLFFAIIQTKNCQDQQPLPYSFIISKNLLRNPAPLSKESLPTPPPS